MSGIRVTAKFDRGTLGRFRIKINGDDLTFETSERRHKDKEWHPALPGPLELEFIRTVNRAISDYEGTLSIDNEGIGGIVKP